MYNKGKKLGMSAIDNSYKMDGDVLLVILFLYTLFFRFNSRSFLCIFNSSCVHCTSALCSSLLHEEGQLNGCSTLLPLDWWIPCNYIGGH